MAFPDHQSLPLSAVLVRCARLLPAGKHGLDAILAMLAFAQHGAQHGQVFNLCHTSNTQASRAASDSSKLAPGHTQKALV